jgi:hypothetical protein
LGMKSQTRLQTTEIIHMTTALKGVLHPAYKMLPLGNISVPLQSKTW